MQVSLKPRSVGELVGLSIKLSVAHFPKLLPVFAILTLPVLALEIHNAEDPQTPTELVVFVLHWVLGSLTSVVATTLVASSFTGVNSSLGKALAIGLRRFAEALAFSIASGALIGVGLVLLIVPGIYLLLRFYVGTPAIVLDDATVGGAFSRSTTLTEGHRWRILGFAVLIMIVMMIPSMVVSSIVASASSADTVPLLVCSWVLNAVFGIVITVAPVVMYFDLRVRRESFDVLQLAELVDRIGRRVPMREAN
jgi:hypothetical protein